MIYVALATPSLTLPAMPKTSETLVTLYVFCKPSTASTISNTLISDAGFAKR